MHDEHSAGAARVSLKILLNGACSPVQVFVSLLNSLVLGFASEPFSRRMRADSFTLRQNSGLGLTSPPALLRCGACADILTSMACGDIGTC